MSIALLDNPIWSALTTTHAHLAVNAGPARRYPVGVSQMFAMRVADEAGYAALRTLMTPGEITALYLATGAAPPYPVVFARDIAQMVLKLDLPELKDEAAGRIETLSAQNVPEMMALAAATNPGPFSLRTIELGDYIGIREQGVLVAMAGVRLRMTGFSEINAVCVLPQWQGHGYGRMITHAVAAQIIKNGDTPFLHVKTDNEFARMAYLRLGFRDRRVIHWRELKLPELG